MKYFFLWVCTLCSILFINGQQNDGGSSGEDTDVNLFSFPVSPEAGRLGTYGNVPVNLSTGQMNFPVNLYTINLNGYSWPISLAYNFKGLRYEDKPSISGLGWGLRSGGVVTREVRGIPDEHPYGYYGASGRSKRILNPYFNNGNISRGDAEELFKGNIDGEADKYYVSVNGVSFSFKIGLNKQPVYLSEHNYKVILDWKNQYELDGFEVIDDNGIKYYFYQKEYNSPLGGNFNVFNDGFTEYTSSWNLDRVVFPNNEELTFTYISRDYYSYDFFASGAANSLQIQCGGPSYTPKAAYNDGFSKTLIKRKILTQINSSVARVSFNLPSQSSASDGYRITYSSITIRNTHSNSILDTPFNSILWDYDFTYFGARDLLTNISRNGKPFYYFSYHNRSLIPNFINDENANVFKQDLWGFYNGVNNQYGVNIPGTSYNADKRPSFGHTSAGALSKITYPTGGSTVINYEQNTTKESYQATLNESQDFPPNWKIHLKFKSDQKNGSGYKEEKYSYTFNDTVVANISYRISALPASRSGVSIQKISGCTGTTNSATLLGDYAHHLRAITADKIPYFCPRVYTVIDDGDIEGNLNDPITKRGSSGGKIKIEPGTYEFKVWTNSNYEPVSGEVEVRFYQPPTTSNNSPKYVNKTIGGIRISKLVNYTTGNTISDTKYFDYIDEEGFSTGKELQRAIIAYRNVVEHCCGVGSSGGSNFVFDYFNRVNYSSKTYNSVNLNQGVPVVYKRVRESSAKTIKTTSSTPRNDCNTPGCLIAQGPIEEGERVLTYIGSQELKATTQKHYPNGYTEFTYDYDPIGLAEYPLVPKGVDQNMGRLLTQNTFQFLEKDIEYKISSTQRNKYSQIRGLLVPGISNTNEIDYDSNHPMSVKIAKKITKEGNCYYYPDDYQVFNYYKFEKYKELDKKYLISQTVTKQYFPQIVVTTQKQSYDSRYQLKKTTITNSENQVIESENFYPYNFSSDVYSKMTSEKILTPIVATITKRNDTIINQTKYEYTKILPDNNNASIIFKPSKKLTAIADEPLRGVTTYEYDKLGNLLQYFKITKDGTVSDLNNPISIPDEGGPTVSAIWGYNYKYPVAQIVNATHEEAISHLTVSISELQNLDGSELENQLDNIRQGLPNAQVTTYSYLPLIGVRSITNPRGYTINYEYDDLYRLKYVRDQEGNILSEKQYNYRD